MLKTTIAAVLIVSSFAFGRWFERQETALAAAEAQAMCKDGIVALTEEGWFCFTESLTTKQWRPRWMRVALILPE